MVKLEKGNIHKIVASQAEADRLIAKGYEALPTLTVEEDNQNFNPQIPMIYKCLICNKEYKTQDGLNSHISQKHHIDHLSKSEQKEGGEPNARPATKDINGSQDGAEAN